MDNETFRLIARLKVVAARNGIAVDALRFVGDPGYARVMLGRFSEGADEDGVLLALQLLDRLGLAGKPAERVVVPLAVAPPQPALPQLLADPAADDRRKYVGSLRG
ncbi:MAG: hypothetical protein ACK5TK_01130 [Betaproteobacteria bacterium]